MPALFSSSIRFAKIIGTEWGRHRIRSLSSATSARTTSIAEVYIGTSSPTDDHTKVLKPYFEEKQPVVLRGAVSNQPAVQLWKSWDHLEHKVNADTLCAVEIGGSYASSEKTEIRFGDYISYLRFFEERHGRSSPIAPPASDLVYLAQNDVADSLRSDFTVPSFTASLGYGHLYSVMMWIGPHGCVSPLHFDPLDNVLMQFVGVKRVLLYPPGTEVYAGATKNQKNTSPHNPEESPDLDKFPLLANLPPAIDCHLLPGDALYIPQKWWHYVRTVETSLSINAWWR